MPRLRTSTIPMRPRYSACELGFLRLMAPLCRAEDLGAVLDRRAPSDILHTLRRHRIPGRCIQVRPMALQAIRRAWREYQQGVQPKRDVLGLWAQRSGSRLCNRGRLWSQGDIEEVMDRVGREPLGDIAADLRRSRSAVSRMLAELGNNHLIYRYSCSALADALSIPRRTVNWWCHPRRVVTVLTDCGQIRRGPRADAIHEWHGWRPPLLRSWLELCWRVVHVDDAEWLLEHYQMFETDWQRLRAEREAGA